MIDFNNASFLIVDKFCKEQPLYRYTIHSIQNAMGKEVQDYDPNPQIFYCRLYIFDFSFYLVFKL